MAKNEKFKIKENELNYVVYQTINTLTQQIYYGVFSFNPAFPKDRYRYENYIGQGITHPSQLDHLKKTEFLTNVQQYGYQSFKRNDILITTSEKEAYTKEIELLNENFLANPLSLNQRGGGKNGKWSFRAKHRKSVGSMLGKNGNAKPVKCSESGKIYSCIKEASLKLKMNYYNLRIALKQGTHPTLNYA
ncbi:hypothetical protein [Zunongwangia atlantica]|uniref:Uncharacterized protein n=1 Tax=Zunongwangia atlantica 22II14-10F7 TaxID=1185767 RepID=A0A1Y1T4A4_9FLAO|nr:hypothetical protein [Zunongwangia atlantica]ORL45405.1 hypothetical protein IIF7_11303 [Zunongwangia atlantica 22II14-10F7]